MSTAPKFKFCSKRLKITIKLQEKRVCGIVAMEPAMEKKHPKGVLVLSVYRTDSGLPFWWEVKTGSSDTARQSSKVCKDPGKIRDSAGQL